MRRPGEARRPSGSLLWLLAAVVAAGVAGCGGGGGGGHETRPASPGASLNELNVTITDAAVADDGHPVVRFFLTDRNGDPLPAADVSIRLVIAVLRHDGSEYQNYITTVQTSPITNVSARQASSENSSQGTLEDLGGGLFRYTFAVTLPAGYDADASHRIAIYATTTILGVSYVSNAIFDFVPSGGPVEVTRDVVRTENCNNCHDPLGAHGGSRRDVRLCITCHTQTITDFSTGEVTPQIDPDTGHNIGFRELIHKIHRGASLPSVEAGTPYQIIGHNQSVADFSDVVFPQDIRNCEKCHGGATDGDRYKTRPSRQACGSCHDDVNFASGENHGGGPQADDFSCSGCHLPETGHEFDISVVGTHVIPAHSEQALSLQAEILSVTSFETGSSTVAPGEHPVVTFRIRTGAGDTLAPSSLNSLSFVLSGSTADFFIQDYNNDGMLTPGDPTSPWTPGAEAYKSESAIADAQAGADGTFTYVFKAGIPMNATGSYAIGVEGYKCTAIQGANQAKGGSNCSGGLDPNRNGREDPGEVFNEIRDAIPNQEFYFAVTDPEPVPRRMPVATDNCMRCHGVFSKDFSVHGGLRNSTNHCPLCHNPSYDTLSRQLPPVGETGITTPVDFKIMIHKIHRGENLTMPYVLYGFLSPAGFPNQTDSPMDVRDIAFPGDLRDCEACHRPATYVLDPGTGVLGPAVHASIHREFRRNASSKTVLAEFTTPPVIAVCTACHDDVDFTTGANHPAGPESPDSCVDCHAVGSPLSAERVHFPPLPLDQRITRPNS
jgi:OmcA/MtrC family decaheme c-type cytochrome